MNRDFGINQALVEELYLRYRENRHAVDESWRRYFDRAAADGASEQPAFSTMIVPSITPPTIVTTNGNGNGHPVVSSNGDAGRIPLPPPLPLPSWAARDERMAASPSQARVASLINAYRDRGHLFAHLDPLELTPSPPTELSIETFGLTRGDLDTEFSTGDLAGPTVATLREIIARCDETYCRTIGVEFMQLESREERLWLQQRMESTANRLALSPDEQRRILTKLTDAEIFEQFIDVNFRNAKRFSCEGTESMIPLLDLLIEEAGKHAVGEIVIGMAHRGRLNVLANIMGKNVQDIFAGFDDKHPEKYLGRGDVKYHLGYSSDRMTTAGQQIHLSLAFNPSHLEFVNPVVEGRVRAKQDRRGDVNRKRVLPLLLHGDAAFMGQGTVAETLNMSGLEGYRTGGTIHVVINNQIGFTTSPLDSRSTRYATDVTRMLKIPVFHVNGEDPEAVAQVTKLAVDYRQKFSRDVCIDLYGYRKHGHNETDNASLTQPVMYAAIKKKPTVRRLYIQRLVEMGSMTEDEAEHIAEARKAALEAALDETRKTNYSASSSAFAGMWARYRGGTDAEVPDVDTSVPAEKLVSLLEGMVKVPEGFTATRQAIEPWERWLRNARAGVRSIEWGAGEALAFASLLDEGTPIRLSGQDVRRGTFSHRNAILTDVNTGKRYCPYDRVAHGAGRFEAWDSPLSEAGVLGFDYGYSLDYPDGLVIWEAQFGDFVNGAQVINDQFISAAEDKWNRLSGVVMLLPHGFEGSGPEHSSARLERFLQLCAEDNMYVCSLTTSAQFFHVLRRQIIRPLRKPLVIMSPKSLLRQAFSSIDEFSHGGFQRMIADTGAYETVDKKRVEIDPAKVDRVLLCSGKIYFEIEAARGARNASNVAIVRLEQLYPLSEKDFERVLAPYKPGTPLVWVQEEPWNMGAWYFLDARLPRLLGDRFPITCIARAESASPATGSTASHRVEQAMLIEEAFAQR